LLVHSSLNVILQMRCGCYRSIQSMLMKCLTQERSRKSKKRINNIFRYNHF
uniref:Ovule protein n=1 Tax=Haemonchus placei TaxID=6290 RepID=A0A0N4WRL2_HAEPC